MRFAIVIPTLDEEATIGQRVAQASALCDLVVVSDGTSRDNTAVVAKNRGARVVSGSSGRGPQLHRGALAAIEAGADALLFLHADTEIPSNTRDAVTSALQAGAVGGGCLIRLPEGSQGNRLMRLAPRLVNWRTRRFRIPLGDQAQFASAEAYRATGGFRDIPILEDLDFIRRLKRHGLVVIPNIQVAPNTRRFVSGGVIRTVVRNWTIFLLYFAGVSPNRLARLYRADVR